MSGTIEGYQCSRCTQSRGYFWTDEYGTMYFCGTASCLKDDSDASKGMARNRVVTIQDASDVFGVGGRYRNASLARWMATEAQQKHVANWMGRPENMLILMGPPGCGKTYFCMAIANRFMEKSNTVFYINAHRFMESITRSIGEGKNQYDTLNKVAKQPILIIDDFGTASSSDWAKEIWFDLIDQRYNSRLPTIITSNLL